MPRTRQLAAIMFTDIAGYTSLMGKDEQKAIELLNRNRQIQRPLIEQHGGRWIKELGDGILASFATGTDAVYCAAAIQTACAAEERVNLRIGIHLGEVLFEGGDVFGDTVNIASRLQALAPVGGIWISEAVAKNISNQKGISTKFVGEEELKNVSEPLRVYEVIPVDYEAEPAGPALLQQEQAKAPPKSVAVLPFVNMSNDPEQEYFSDGIAEEIINSLAHLRDLKVAGRTSSSQFKGAKVDLREVGEKLGVATVLEGSVRKQGNKLRVTAQLINVADGFHLWSGKYDRSMDDIFAIQDDIALAITEQLEVTLLGSDREIITKTTTLNAEAYELYLKGVFHINRRGSSVLTGLRFFEQAIAIDPAFALAYTGYADALFLGAFYSFFPGSEVKQKMKQAADTAVKLDESRWECYCTLANYYVALEWNWAQGEENYLKSIELNPRFAQARALYGLAKAVGRGEFDEGEKQGRIAIKLEPLSAIAHADLAWSLHTAGRSEEGLYFAQAGVELDQNSFLSHRVAGLCYLSLGRYDEAIDTFQYLVKTSNQHQHAVNSLIWAHCSKGNIPEAKALFNGLEERSKSEYIAGAYIGVSAAYLNDLDASFHYLEKAFLDRDPLLIHLKFSPDVPALLRNDTRFQNVINRTSMN
ncbi:adenylate/guanylate cyclase domain-containing protein [Pontibacter pamirensis]|uniref:adenylate/guanylate cyclase domain-containing protein n=1 Tax=Pontibacter pamirensis TaxID=2562824 RepID=UPI001389E4C4|nr:adenylate/guanylate cyclase domain-containing protein [Pontibacter pamirensis]